MTVQIWPQTKRSTLRAIVKSNSWAFGHIKVSGRGRTNAVIIQEINEVLQSHCVEMKCPISSLRDGWDHLIGQLHRVMRKSFITMILVIVLCVACFDSKEVTSINQQRTACLRNTTNNMTYGRKIRNITDSFELWENRESANNSSILDECDVPMSETAPKAKEPCNGSEITEFDTKSNGNGQKTCGIDKIGDADKSKHNDGLEFGVS